MCAACASLPFPRAGGVLIIPAGLCLLDPLLRETAADLRLPVRVAIGDRDLAIDRRAVAVLVGEGGVQARTFGQRCERGVAQRNEAVAAETDRAGAKIFREARRETFLHARLAGLDLRRLDIDVGLL